MAQNTTLQVIASSMVKNKTFTKEQLEDCVESRNYYYDDAEPVICVCIVTLYNGYRVTGTSTENMYSAYKAAMHKVEEFLYFGIAEASSAPLDEPQAA